MLGTKLKGTVTLPPPAVFCGDAEGRVIAGHGERASFAGGVKKQL